jgi:hypothetical protein
VSLLVLLLLTLQSAPTCSDSTTCRTAAEAAAARGDYETFHDLAWRAVQKGQANDPSLMLLLARAQSLSGRPDDALVMLARIADLHVPVDITLPDFDRARRLPGWAEVAARLAAAAPAPAAAVSAPAAAAVPAPPTGPPAPAPETPSPPAKTGRGGKAVAASSPALAPSVIAPSSAAAAPSAAGAPPPADALTFDAPPTLEPFALAHDAVSRRFVLGDAASRRLFIVDEVSKHVVNYVSAASAGFYDALTALTIDARRGDLWVASVNGAGHEATSIVHKLQLVSGRGLTEVRPADALKPIRIVALAVTPDGTLYALDGAGGRVLRLHPGVRALEVVQRLDAPNPTALAAADDHTLFVATDRGLLRVDAASHSVQALKSVEDLAGFTSLAWRNGTLVGVQRASGAWLVVRVAVDAGGRALPRAILASDTAPIIGTLAAGTFYYLVNGTIHQLPIR